MQKFLHALAIAGTLSIILACAGYFLMGRDGATTFGLLPLLAVNSIVELLEKQSFGETVRMWAMSPIVRAKGFALPWKLMLPLGILITGIAPQAGAGLGTFIFGAMLGHSVFALPQKTLSAAGVIGTLLVGIVACFIYGRWLGRRCLVHAAFVGMIATLLGVSLAHAVDFLFMSPERFQAALGVSRSMKTFALEVATGSLVQVPSTMLGVIVGRAGQVGEYMRYLSRTLPPQRRDALAQLMREG